MNIQRINTYSDQRFSQKVLNQHGYFLVDDEPYEVEILSDREALIRGREESAYPQIIQEFRFFTPQITSFYNTTGDLVQKFPPVTFLTVPLTQIQPSQFFVDEEKVQAISTFLSSGEDIIIQVLRQGDRYISLDGHTRLYYAVKQGWPCVRAVEENTDSYIFDFVTEAQKRGINSPYDLAILPHAEYEVKWNKFCDDFFDQRECS